MQILPTLPTDNIYKLKAVAGLWMLAGLFVFGFWSVYWQYQVEVQTRHTMAYYSSVNSERNIVARINSIQSGNINENKVKWIPSNLGVDEEKKLLEIALVNNRKIIAMYKKEAEEEGGGFLFYLGERYIMAVLLIYMFFMFYFLYFGFLRWYRLVQKPSEQALAAENEIKRLTIKKINLEIAELLRSEQLLSVESEIKKLAMKKINLEIAALSKKERKPFKGCP